MKSRICIILVTTMISAPPSVAFAQSTTVDTRAARIVDAMTLQEQLSLLRPLQAMSFANIPGAAALPPDVRAPIPEGAIGSAGFVPSIPALSWPALQESDAGLGVANIEGILRPNDEATALPASLALASSFDLDLARLAGTVVGAEAHAKGFNVQLAGGVDLARDPRNGRNFEYVGEDPLLAGQMAGAQVAGIQSQHVVSTVKHYALNDQESGRNVADSAISEAGARESDLLAFQIAIEEGHPGSVMCAYNKVNGDYACESDFLLNQVLKHDWKFPGWVMSDWGAVHSEKKAIAAGLDQESPGSAEFKNVEAGIASGEISKARIRESAIRIVRSLIAVGALDDPAKPGGFIDQQADGDIAQAEEENGAVLLKNDGMLPLTDGRKRVLLVGGHADRWVMIGGGSSQVNPYGGIHHATVIKNIIDLLMQPSFVPSSPLQSLRALRPDLEINFDDGTNHARAAEAARKADIVLVFATKSQSEGVDSSDLSLPNGQDDLIAAVAAANPNTGVILETGNPIVMPWLHAVKAVLEAWYPGQRGGEAIAAILTGKVSSAGRLPITFPTGVAQLPRSRLDGFSGAQGLFGAPSSPFVVQYGVEGSDVGYRWYERTEQTPLFPFGYGLTYTKFAYNHLQITDGKALRATFDIKNEGNREGVEVAQLYVAPPGRTHRLTGWARVSLKPGESRIVTITADPRLLVSYQNGGWVRAAGSYDVWVSPSAKLSGLHAVAQMFAIDASAGQR